MARKTQSRLGGGPAVMDRAPKPKERAPAHDPTPTQASDPPPTEKPVSAAKVGKVRRRGKLKNLVFFARQLYVLVSCGTPLAQALGALERQTRDEPWRAVIGSIRRQLEEGTPLAEALESHPECFDTIWHTLVAAGEASGQLDVMFERLADLVQRQLQTRRAIIGALVYPVVLISVAFGALIMMLTLVLPRFAGLFEALDVPLPPTTKALVVIGDGLVTYWWIILLAIGGLVAGGIASMKSTSTRRRVDRMVLKMPQFGDIVRSFTLAKIARVLGIMVNSRIPLLEAMELTRRSLKSVIYSDLLLHATDEVSRGETLSSSIDDPLLVSPSLVEAIRSGEESGQLGELLVNVAGFLDQENEATVKSLASIIEPIILVVLGVIIGIVAISLFLPLFDLTALAGS